MRLLRGKVPLVLDEYGYRFELGKGKPCSAAGNDVLVIGSRPDDHARPRGGRPAERGRGRRGGAARADHQAAGRGRDLEAG
jgi:hypothetical protein